MNDCEFKQRGIHSWYCTVHDVEVTFGHDEPITCRAAMNATLRQDITAEMLAMSSHTPGEGYAPNDVIGPAGTTVTLMDDVQWHAGDSFIEVTDFANDPFAAGFVTRDMLVIG